MGVGGVKPIGVGQDNQQVGVNQVGHQRRQAIVISENLANFIYRDYIVFVQDGHYVQRQEGHQSVTDVQVRLPVGQVVDREQRLSHSYIVSIEQLGIGVD